MPIQEKDNVAPKAMEAGTETGSPVNYRLAVRVGIADCPATVEIPILKWRGLFPRDIGRIFGTVSRAPPLIVVVDDDTAVLNSLGFMLEAEGFEVRAFSDIGELLRADSIHEANCLVVDYRMLAMNGFDVLRSLRKRRITAPAILITARSAKKLAGRAAAAGFARVVEMPDLEDELVGAIWELTAQVGDSGERPGNSTT